MIRRTTLLAALAALGIASRAEAQVTLEVRGGASMGAYEATSAGFQTVAGPAFGATVGYTFRPGFEAFAGYSREQFGCEEGFCAAIDPTFTRSGAEAGLRVELPARLWLRGALAGQTLAVSSGIANTDETSGGSLGVKLGGGIALPLGPRIAITPGIEYSRFTTDLDGGDDAVGVLTAGVGLRFRF